MPSSVRSRRSPLTHATPIPGQLHVGLSSWAEWIFTAHGPIGHPRFLTYWLAPRLWHVQSDLIIWLSTWVTGSRQVWRVAEFQLRIVTTRGHNQKQPEPCYSRRNVRPASPREFYEELGLFATGWRMPGPKTQHHPSVRYVGFSLLLLACVCSLPLVLCVRCASRPDSSRAQVRKKIPGPTNFVSWKWCVSKNFRVVYKSQYNYIIFIQSSWWKFINKFINS